MLFLVKKTVRKHTWKIFLLLCLASNLGSKACSPLNAPNLLSQSITGTTLALNWQSTTIYTGCPDFIDVEIACSTGTFSGLAAFTFTSAALTLSANPQTFPTQYIDISNLCSGTIYKFRARQRNGTISSPWTSTFTFTTTGVFITPTLLLQQTNTVVCPGQTDAITALSSGCGSVGTTYSWAPSTGLSCVTCTNPIASPIVPTSYTCTATGGQLGCWTQSDVITVNVANPTLTINSPSICPGETATLTVSGADFYSWSAGSFPNGPSSGGAAPLITTNYTVTGNLSGCTSTILATVSVYPPPVIAVNNLTVCFNQPINLTSGGGSSYLWNGPLSYTSAAQNPTIAAASMAMSGQYIVTATSAFGCTNSAVSTVTVMALPVPTITANNTVCSGSPLYLSGTGASTYSWYGPNGFSSALQNSSIPNISVLGTGIYTLVGTVGTCSGSTTKSVTVLPVPVPLVLNNGPVCVGNPITFTASGAVTYTWAGPANYTSNIQNPVINPSSGANAGTYTLTVAGANNCTSAVSSTIVINPLPVIPVNNLTVCLNQPVNLTSGGGANYLWAGPNSFTSSSQNPVIPIATDLQSGIYTVTVITSAGCTKTAVTTVTAVGLPSPTITSVDSLCAGASLTLTGSGGNSYNWSGPNGFNSTLQSPVINNINAPGTGIYSLTVFVTLGNCSATTTRSVTVMPLPIPAVSNATVCEKKGFQLTANGGVSYEWFGPNGFHSNTRTPQLPSALTANAGIFTYTLGVTGSNLCNNTTIVLLTVYPNPVIQAAGATVCNGQPAVLTSNGGLYYNWTGPNNFTAATANATIANVNQATTGTYTIIVGSVNSCTSVIGVYVDLVALPVPSVIVTPTVCLNSVISLQAVGGDAYRWNGPSDFLSTHGNTSFTATSMGLNGTYTLSAYNSAGCVGYTTAVITVYPLPSGALTSNNKISCVPFCSDFKLADISSAPVVNTSWEINSQVFPSESFHYCFSDPGNYKVKGSFKDSNGCTNTSTFVIDAYEVPVADFVFSPDQPVEDIDEVLFTNTSSGNQVTKWNWSFINNSGYKSTEPNPSYFFEEAGIYPVSLVVKNVWGCSDTAIKTIHIESDFNIFVPDAFTPNEDGRNEIFQPKGRGVVAYDLIIFDRWGEPLFHTSNFNEGWDGTFKSKVCQSGVYQWKINAADRNGKTKNLSGSVTLYR